VSRIDSTSNPAGIITNKRALESTVIVDDNQIVVLGGLIQDQLTDNADKVPVIGDIPLLGALFRYDTRQRTKTNLMVFLKPTVVRQAAGAASITDDRYDYLIGEQNAQRPAPRFFWTDPTNPQLPPPGIMPGMMPTPAKPPAATTTPAVPQANPQPSATPPSNTQPSAVPSPSDSNAPPPSGKP